jgi:hypothetical protein
MAACARCWRRCTYRSGSQARVAFERLLARLNEVAPGDWLLKGGFALDLRLADRARATRDVDLDWQADEEELAETLTEAAGLSGDDFFTFGIDSRRPAGATHRREGARAHAPVRRRSTELASQGPDRHRPDGRACLLRVRPVTGRDRQHVPRTRDARSARVATRTLRRLVAALIACWRPRSSWTWIRRQGIGPPRLFSIRFWVRRPILIGGTSEGRPGDIVARRGAELREEPRLLPILFARFQKSYEEGLSAEGRHQRRRAG